MASDRSAEHLARDLRRAVPETEITTSGRRLDHHATDFGRVVRRRAAVLARPRTVEAVCGLIRFARTRGLRLGPQASAHSQGGQSLVEDGLQLDLSGLAAVQRVEDDRFECAAGTLWRDVLVAALERGRVPPVLTTHLFTTVGGTHSVGGIGHSSFRWGPQVDCCLRLQLVTGTGECVNASADERPELFAGALGGLGQIGIITAVTHRLRPHRPYVRSVRLVYRDRGRMLAEARRVAAGGAVEYLHADAVAVAGGWLYTLSLARELDGPEESGADPLASVSRGAAHRLSDAVLPFDGWVLAGRTGPVPPRTLQPGMVRPGIDVFLPADAAREYERELRSLLPAEMVQRSLFLTQLVSGSGRGRTLLQLPDAEELELLSVLPTVPAAEAARVLAALERALARADELGGKQYPAGWLRGCPASWRSHYGAAAARVAGLRARHDPDSILAPSVPRL